MSADFFYVLGVCLTPAWLLIDWWLIVFFFWVKRRRKK